MFEHLEGRITGLQREGAADKMSRIEAEAQRDSQFLVCPSWGGRVKRRLRNCPQSHAGCTVSNVRAAIARNEGLDNVSRECVCAVLDLRLCMPEQLSITACHMTCLSPLFNVVLEAAV